MTTVHPSASPAAAGDGGRPAAVVPATRPSGTQGPGPAPVRKEGRPRIRSTKGRDIFVKVSMVWMVLLAAVIMLEPLLPIPDPAAVDYYAIAVAPGQSVAHPLGTDAIGRDILARLVTGGRVSLTVGLGAVAIAAMFGTVLGIIAAFFKGLTDRVVGSGVDIFLAFPPLVAIIALSVFMGPSLSTLVIALGLIFTPQVARVARSAALPYVSREFVTAARGMGSKEFRILWREVAPNAIVPVLSYAVVLVAMAIGAEGGMSFLGLGVPPPQSSWGTMMGEGRAVLAASPHVVLVPATTMFLTLISLNFLADYISRRFDIKEAAL
ncbi:ABC transporter permease [Arthrobacter ginkgonis]|uniref:ABC transporter permease n=1 Tax=Arthrobacter ginkgonis TaxID=1630594 RepID=A0ABP7DBW2_9MICC